MVRIAAIVWAALALAAGGAFASGAPARVASINLCTDQLALMLAAPGQLVTVSSWAARPEASMLAAEAARLPLNGATAEEVFARAPDLVLASNFTRADTVALLRRLGVRVEVFPAATELAQIPGQILRMGALLGRDAEAAALAGAFEADLARETARAAGLPRLRAAWWYANGYTSGVGTLADDVTAAAGLDNVAAGLGLGGIARLPLERLVMERPFLIGARHISVGDGPAVGRAYEGLAHPALVGLKAEGAALVEERWQVCGLPFVALAVRALVDAR